MATIIVTCKYCRKDCSISAEEVVLVIHEDPEESFYNFMCTACKQYNKKQADEETISLIEGCVTVTTVAHMPQPITSEEVESFANDLADGALMWEELEE